MVTQCAAPVALARDVDARLEALERRTSALVHDHDLAVDDGAVAAQRASQSRQLRISRRLVAAAPSGETVVSVLDRGERAHTVPLQLEDPAVPGERPVHGSG